MADNTAIEWTDATWNPLLVRDNSTGKVGYHCEKVSEACTHCYAETFNSRKLPHRGTGHPYARKSLQMVTPFVDEKTLQQPIRWTRGRRIFVCSMTDIFGDWYTDEQITQLFDVMLRTPQHTYQILTKRPERMATYFQGYSFPPKNIWAGTTIENQQRADERVLHLCNTPAAVRFLSIEPLLGPVDLLRIKCPKLAKPGTTNEPHRVDVLRGGYWEDRDVGWKGFVNHSDFPGRIGWVIVGGESGRAARPMNPEWVVSLRDQCRDAHVPFFLKQWGEWVGGEDFYTDTDDEAGPAGTYAQLHNDTVVREAVVGADRWKNWNEDTDDGCRVNDPVSVRVGKKAAGKLLGGVEYMEFPTCK